jgi:NAD(P)H-hydrate repair Nnr-like enzyme with NAD(P)H-hydrate epimerase domain
MIKILVSDPTLRDGNHAVGHQLNADQVAKYAAAAEAARIPVVEVGHGNGLGASSLQVGECALGDVEMLEIARRHLVNSQLGVHVIPGFATIHRDLQAALSVGVDVFRIAAHCTEADLTQRHISHVRNAGRQVFGVLMMSHMAPPEVLREEALKMESYGAEGVILMDSAGAYLPRDVTERVGELAEHLSIPVGFHAHNNLGMAVANTVAALEAGATIVDGTARGFGAGAGKRPAGGSRGRAGQARVRDRDRPVRRAGRGGPGGEGADALCALHQLHERGERAARRLLSPGYGQAGAAPLRASSMRTRVTCSLRSAKRRVVAGQEDLIIEWRQRVASALARRRG